MSLHGGITHHVTPSQARRLAWKRGAQRERHRQALETNFRNFTPESHNMTAPNTSTFPLPDDFDLREELRVRMESKRSSQATIAREAGVSSSTLSQWLGGTYPGNDANVREKLISWYRARLLRESSSGLPVGPEFVETPTTKRIIDALRYAQLGPDNVIVYGAAGVSKTKAAEKYRRSTPNVWIATMSPATSGVAAMLEAIAEAVGLRDLPASASARFKLICSRVGTERAGGLLIIDEAQHLSPVALDQARAIPDAVSVGLVLMGNEQVYSRLVGGTTRAAYLDRLHSRIGKKLQLKAPGADDIELLTRGWGVKDPACAQQLRDIARKPGGGGLRVLAKILRLASSYAQAGDEELCCAHVRAAVVELGVTE